MTITFVELDRNTNALNTDTLSNNVGSLLSLLYCFHYVDKLVSFLIVLLWCVDIPVVNLVLLVFDHFGIVFH